MKCRPGPASSERKRLSTNPAIPVRFSPLQRMNISFTPWQKNMGDLNLFECSLLRKKETKAPSTGNKEKADFTLSF